MSKLDILRSCLVQAVNSIDAGNTNLDEDQCEEVIDMINHIALVENKYSKYQACKYLGVSIATFDRYVKEKLIPEGRRQQGFKEIFWIKQDLIDAKNRINRR